MSDYPRRNQRHSRSQYSSSSTDPYGQDQGYDYDYNYETEFPQETSYGYLSRDYGSTSSATPQPSSRYSTQSTPYLQPVPQTRVIQYGSQGSTPYTNGTDHNSSYGQDSTPRYRDRDEREPVEPRSTHASSSMTYDPSESYTIGAIDTYRSSTDRASTQTTYEPRSVDGSQNDHRSTTREGYTTSHQSETADFNAIGAQYEDTSGRYSDTLSVSSLSSTPSSTISGRGTRSTGGVPLSRSSNYGYGDRARDDATGYHQQRPQVGGGSSSSTNARSSAYQPTGDSFHGTADASANEYDLNSSMRDLSVQPGQNTAYATPRDRSREQPYYADSSSTSTVVRAASRESRSSGSQRRSSTSSSSTPRRSSGSSRSAAPPSSSSSARRPHRTSTTSASRPRRLDPAPIEEYEEPEDCNDMPYNGSGRRDDDYEDEQDRNYGQYPYSSDYTGLGYPQY